MALSSESVLENAMKKIVGEPGTTDSRPAQIIPENVIAYSGDFLDRDRLKTVANPSGAPSDVIKTSTPVAAPAVAPVIAPAVLNPWDKPAATASINKGFFYDPYSGQVQVGGMWGAPDKMTVVNPTNINDPGIYHTMDWAIGTRRGSGFGEATDPGTAAALKLYGAATPAAQQQAFNEYGKYYYSKPGETGGLATSKPAAAGGQSAAMAATAAAEAGRSGGAAPVRPTGRNVSWQADQQYWKDMDTYRKAGGK